MRGTVFDSLRSYAPLKGATVVINELPLYATTDGRGRFEFDIPVPNGNYTITFLHPTLDSLLMSAEVLPFSVSSATTVNTRLSIPSASTLVAKICRGRAEPSTGVLIGRVRDVDDSSAIVGARVTTDWLELQFEKDGRLSRRPQRVSTLTGPGGTYVLCGAPIDIAVDVTASRDSATTGPVEPFRERPQVARRDFALAPRAAAGATLTVTVHTASGGFAKDALVGVLGTELTGHTNDQGRLVIANVPPGTQSVEVRQIGTRPVTQIVDLPSGRATSLDVKLDQFVTALPTVAVTGRSRTGVDKNGFDERARRGLGHYIGSEELAKHPASDLVDIVARSPGVIRQWGPKGAFLAMRSNWGGPCIPAYIVDGLPWMAVSGGNSAREISDYIRPEDIKSIEVYSGIGKIPSIFDRANGCGAVVIWTK